MSAISLNNHNDIHPLSNCCSAAGKQQNEKDVEMHPDNFHDLPSKRNPGYCHVSIGIAVALGVVGFYFGLLTLTSDWNNAMTQFKAYRWWIIALSVGLGIQATLFSFMRKRLKSARLRAATSSLTVSGGMSTASMAACCAHYLAPLLPALGLPFLSAAVAGIAEYQSVFFFFGVLSNVFGIGFMLRLMNRNGIVPMQNIVGNINRGFRNLLS